MKNLIGYLNKILYLCSLVLFILPIKIVFADNDFTVYTNFQHTISENTINTEAILQIRSDTTKVLSYYTASIPEKNLDVECYYVLNNEKIDCTIYHRGSTTDVLLDLDNAIVKKDTPVEVKLVYTTTTDIKNSYNISSKILDSTTNNVSILYPQSKGEPLWTSEPIQDLKISNDQYQIYINQPVHSEISILLGQEIGYKFSVSRVFSNTGNDETQTFELVIPPDTQSQSIIWEDISPLPNSSTTDEDGNYIFKYLVSAGQTIDCKITGYIKKQTSILQEGENSTYLIKETGYWNITDTAEKKRVVSYLKEKGLEIESDFDSVEQLKVEEKELFYKYIYQYVIERLNFPSEITLGIDNNVRLGANSVIQTPNNATSQDYADFYIALLRKFEVPSRLVIGYVSNISGYASDGFYNYWVEYFDESSNQWVSADPFLEEYFGHTLFGSDFYDHIVILRRGKSPLSPTITFYNQNDFTITLDSNSSLEENFNVESELVFDEYNITHKYSIGYIYISNTGNTAITGFSTSQSNINNISKYIDPVSNSSSQIILPKQNTTIQLNIPFEEIVSTNLFVNIKYTNFNGLEKENILETILPSGISTQMKVLSKIISITIFSVGIVLVYLILTKIIKKKNE